MCSVKLLACQMVLGWVALITSYCVVLHVAVCTHIASVTSYPGKPPLPAQIYFAAVEVDGSKDWKGFPHDG